MHLMRRRIATPRLKRPNQSGLCGKLDKNADVWIGDTGPERLRPWGDVP